MQSFFFVVKKLKNFFRMDKLCPNENALIKVENISRCDKCCPCDNGLIKICEGLLVKIASR